VNLVKHYWIWQSYKFRVAANERDFKAYGKNSDFGGINNSGSMSFGGNFNQTLSSHRNMNSQGNQRSLNFSSQLQLSALDQPYQGFSNISQYK
jgi:hypothetical protein